MINSYNPSSQHLIKLKGDQISTMTILIQNTSNMYDTHMFRKDLVFSTGSYKKCFHFNEVSNMESNNINGSETLPVFMKHYQYVLLNLKGYADNIFVWTFGATFNRIEKEIRYRS